MRRHVLVSRLSALAGRRSHSGLFARVIPRSPPGRQYLFPLTRAGGSPNSVPVLTVALATQPLQEVEADSSSTTNNGISPVQNPCSAADAGSGRIRGRRVTTVRNALERRLPFFLSCSEALARGGG